MVPVEDTEKTSPRTWLLLEMKQNVVKYIYR